MSQSKNGVADASSTAGSSRNAGTGPTSIEASLIASLEDEDSRVTEGAESGSPDAAETTALSQGNEERDGPPEDAPELQDSSGDTPDEAEDATGGDTDGEEEGERTDGERPSRVQRRIDGLVAQVKDLKRKLEEATKASGEDAKADGGGGSGYDPVGRNPQVAKAREAEQSAQAEVARARQLRRLLRSEPDKVASIVAGAFKVNDPTPEQVQDLLEDHEERWRDRLLEARSTRADAERAMRTNLTQARAGWDQVASRRHPWLNKEDDPRVAEVEKMLSANPWTKDFPAARLAAAYLVQVLREESQRDRQQGAGAQAGANGQPSRVRPGGAPSGAPPPRRATTGRAQRLADADKRLLAGNSDPEALEEYLDAVMSDA